MSLRPSSPHPPQQPPPLPDEQEQAQSPLQAGKQAPVQTTRPPRKRKRLTGLWVLLLLMSGTGFLYWQYELAKFRLFGFQPPEMAMARYTPKDVIGDLGGLKVRIPRHYAEYVVYDGDPRWGKKRKGPIPERTFNSKLRNFGIRARFPDMRGLENAQLQEELRSYSLNPDNPWLNMTINSGKITQAWARMHAMAWPNIYGSPAPIGGTTTNVCLKMCMAWRRMC
ncbi:MAG: hypothetical protein Q4A28_08460 [Brachymonas sp.]|nr:hypothetical protein [Brachymonas sp.]